MIRDVWDKITNRKQSISQYSDKQSLIHEFCPRCEANITLQKGYSNELPYWICKGCGEMLINPEVEAESGIAWVCDNCGEMLNIQDGFSEDCGEWQCTVCGFTNSIDASEVYSTDDEYQADLKNPYKGLSDEQVLELSLYQDKEYINGRSDIILVKDRDTDELYIKKLLTTYDRTVYEYLKSNPINHMPRIIGLYEGSNSLIVIEEYLKGRTVEDILNDEVLDEIQAIAIARDICQILDELHHLQKPIIHRDIKPSNIMICDDGEVYLLDINVAKWYDPEKNDDTRYLGTQYYAAPEQVGFGLSASSAKSDIYAVGMLMNVMLTGHFPKEERAKGRVWDVIEKCISLDADNRYTAKELIGQLDILMR